MYYVQPPFGTQLNYDHPLTQGLAWFAPLLEGQGNVSQDLIGGLNLTVPNGVWAAGQNQAQGSGINSTSSAITHTVGLPGNIYASQIVGPYTLICGMTWNGVTQSSFAPIFSMWASATSQIIELGWNGTTAGQFRMLHSTSATVASAAGVIPANTYTTIAGTCGSPSSTNTPLTIYANGQQIATGSGAAPSITWGANPMIYVGNQAGGSFNPETKFSWAAIYNIALPAADIASLSENPWQLFLSPKVFTFKVGSIITSVGTAPGTSTAAATGASLFKSTASAPAISAASASGLAVFKSVASASATSTATATSIAIVKAVASGQATSTASATGASITRSVATALASSTANSTAVSKVTSFAIATAVADSEASAVGATSGITSFFADFGAAEVTTLTPDPYFSTIEPLL